MLNRWKYYDVYTSLNLHFDNNLIDSAMGKTVTNNNTTFSDTVYKWGGYSCVFNGINAYLVSPDYDSWNFATGDFTVDGWFNFADKTGGQILVYQGSGNTEWYIYKNVDHKLYLYARIAGVVNAYYGTTSAVNFVNDTWYHITVERFGANVYIFVNGTSQTLTVTTAIDTMPNVAVALLIGSNGSEFFNGKMDELRISTGIARWTSDFIPYSLPYGTTDYIIKEPQSELGFEKTPFGQPSTQAEKEHGRGFGSPTTKYTEDNSK